MNNIDENLMRQAVIEAQKAEQKNEVPVGAVISCNNRIIARAHNLTERLKDVTAHAEMQAITAAANYIGGKYLRECTLYVTVEPCPMCAGAIYWSQLGRIVFGTRDEKRGFNKICPTAIHSKTLLSEGILEEECAELMRSFFRKKRK